MAKIGKNVDAWCTRCKLVLAHTVELMVDTKVTRVHCNTCGGQHAYRATAPAARAAGPRPRGGAAGRRAAPEPTTQSKYAALLRGRTAAAARPYAMSARFAVGDLIAHDTFGLGAVTGERDHIKIEVLFPDGPRVLVHGH